MTQTATVPPGALRAVIANRLDTKGLSLRGVEKATGIKSATLSRRLRGIGRGFTESELVMLSVLFGESLSDLVAEAERGEA